MSEKAISRKTVEREIRWMRSCAVKNDKLRFESAEMALNPRSQNFHRGVAAGLRLAAQAMENAIK